MSKYKYEVIIYWSDEDKAYIAEVPELAGCMADGDTSEKALQNIQVIISEWIETAKSLGREIPMPVLPSVAWPSAHLADCSRRGTIITFCFSSGLCCSLAANIVTGTVIRN